MVDYLLNSKAFRWTLVVIALGLLAIAAFRIYGAGAYYYEGAHFYVWEDRSAKVCDSSTDWADETEEAAENFDEDTDLRLTWQDPCLTTKEIVNVQWDYGNVDWMGFAYTYTNNGSDPCWNWEWTGNCGHDDDNKVDFAYIIWNDHYEDQINEAEWQARHEMGHVFGLRHPAGSECNSPQPSVMFTPTQPDGNCDTFYDELQEQDIEDIDTWY